MAKKKVVKKTTKKPVKAKKPKKPKIIKGKGVCTTCG